MTIFGLIGIPFKHLSIKISLNNPFIFLLVLISSKNIMYF
jgi:hypothetical protein